jgi:hypothetical protein
MKRSANEEFFDTKGFKGKKRTPMYNKKYVERARKNLEDSYFDDKYEDIEENQYYESNELRPYYKSNRRMYQDMVDMNESKQNLQNRYGKRNSYPKLSEIDDSYQSQKDQENLKNEIKTIKKMLEDTKEKMSTYKCPIPQNSSVNSVKSEIAPTGDKDLVSSIIDSAPKGISYRPNPTP